MKSEEGKLEDIFKKTPFEKSIRRRLDKVYRILDKVISLKDYTVGRTSASPHALLDMLKAYAALDESLVQAICEYLQVARNRRILFKSSKLSIKQIAFVIKKKVVSSKSFEIANVEAIKALYANILCQNPLAPPFDLARPDFSKDFDAYNQSYDVLLRLFKTLVMEFEKTNLDEGSSSTLEDCNYLIEKAEIYQKAVSKSMQRAFVLNEERLSIFDLIVVECKAIYNRTRHLYGSHHPTYKEIYTLIYAVI